MKDLEKMLKDGAKQVLPDESFKDRLVHEIATPNVESESLLQTTSGTATKGAKSDKITIITFFAMLVALIIALSVAFWPKQNSNMPVSTMSYVSIDVNPSIEIVLDENDEVQDVYGLNNEGAVLIYGETFTGSKERVVQRITELMYRCGYFDANDTMRLLVDSSDEKAEELYEGLKQAINEKFNALSVNCNIEGVPEDMKEEAKKHGMSGAKYYLAYLLSQENGDDIENYFEEKYEDLHKREKNYDKDQIDGAIAGIGTNGSAIDYMGKIFKLSATEDFIEDIIEDVERGRRYKEKLNRLNKDLAEMSDILGGEYSVLENLPVETLIDALEDLEEVIDEVLDSIEEAFDEEKKNFIQNFLPPAPDFNQGGDHNQGGEHGEHGGEYPPFN